MKKTFKQYLTENSNSYLVLLILADGEIYYAYKITDITSTLTSEQINKLLELSFPLPNLREEIECGNSTDRCPWPDPIETFAECFDSTEEDGKECTWKDCVAEVTQRYKESQYENDFQG